MERRTLLGRLTWQLGEVVATQPETARTKSITLTVPNWREHRAGQHVDVRLTAEDGYQAERSYSIASPPEQAPRVTLTVERLDDGEVSPYLTEELRVGDKLELLPSHCDTTVNLYDYFHVIRDDRLEAIWPIAARGATQ